MTPQAMIDTNEIPHARVCGAVPKSTWLVDEVEPQEHPAGETVVRMAYLDDDAHGQVLEVFWEREVDAQVLGKTTWITMWQRSIDQPQAFGSHLNAMRLNCLHGTGTLTKNTANKVLSERPLLLSITEVITP